jgi:hypothetical protein
MVMSFYEDWAKRGYRPLSKEEIEQTLSKYPLLRTPRHIFILDGVIHPESRLSATIIGMVPERDSTIVLTQVSNEENLIHETMHITGFGEILTKILSRIAILKPTSIIKKKVVYEQCQGCPLETELLARTRLEAPPGHEPKLIHYVLRGV